MASPGLAEDWVGEVTGTGRRSEHSGYWPDNQGTAVVPVDRGLTGNQVLVDSKALLRGDDHLSGLQVHLTLPLLSGC